MLINHEDRSLSGLNSIWIYRHKKIKPFSYIRNRSKCLVLPPWTILHLYIQGDETRLHIIYYVCCHLFFWLNFSKYVKAHKQLKWTAQEAPISLLKHYLQYSIYSPTPRGTIDIWLKSQRTDSSVSCGKLIKEKSTFRSYSVASDFLF